MSVYEKVEIFLPELETVKTPTVTNDFDQFYAWINSKNSNLHKLVFEEFYENKIDECKPLLDAGVDTVKLQNHINQNIEKINSGYSSADNMDDYEGDILNIEDRYHDAFFLPLQQIAQEYNLTTLVVSGNDPYWIILPNQQEQIVKLIDAFNLAFKDEGLEMSEVE